MKNSKRNLGKWGEDRAVDYLSSKGYSIITRNYHTRHGELDIIASKDGILVFVEVKTRSSHNFSFPEESVTRRKQAYLLDSAANFMELHTGDFTTWQFDVIAIERNGPDIIQIEHFENVIQ
jgi:putative endonuclease